MRRTKSAGHRTNDGREQSGFAKKRKHRLKGAKRRGIEFTLTSAQLKALLSGLENARCQSCRRPFDFCPNHSCYPSIDRLDPREGYHFWNVVLLCRQCNSLKANVDGSSDRQAESQLQNHVTEWFASQFALNCIMGSYR